MVPVIDISQYQGEVDFERVKSTGVEGVIIRASHGRTIDPKLETYSTAARRVFPASAVGYYTFCNPKRSSASDAAHIFMNAVEDAHGSLDTFLMLDVESYANETPSRGLSWTPQAFSAWLNEMVATLRLGAPEARVLVYSNAAFWDTYVGSGSFGDLDIIVARYPFYSPTSQKPPKSAAEWEHWIMSSTTKRPVVPRGWDTWDGWQFSAGYNAAGPNYGVQSADLDLNIIKPEAWARWTKSAVTPAPIPAPPASPEAAATGDDPVLIIGRDANHDDPKRWAYNGIVKGNPTETAARLLVKRGLTAGTTLESPEWLSDEEIAAIPTVG